MFGDSKSPKYQKFKTDELPIIVNLKQDWDWNDLLKYYSACYGKVVNPVKRRNDRDISDDCKCPHCGHSLVAKKNRKFLLYTNMLENADNMPAKWQLLIYLGQKTILNLQNSKST